ncbi:hypothetical protein [Citricoccus muralis]|uniref:EccD-like transmembrane domain-containing protein n=1 Tax=Citricoccus muralis TaxID=169134 RepID=A0ABY8H6N4_9MICC|nr:hypothetical protein [Citricoccus muralis]WFP16804.1 hypothetical protein P8192_01355 [Citricoccus muralis]
MPSAPSSSTRATVPVTFRYESVTYDVALPQSTSLAESLPMIADEMGILTPQRASSGFRVSNNLGEELELEARIGEIGIQAGEILTIQTRGDSTQEQIYDDLVEALGDAVDAQEDAWTPKDSMRLCVIVSSSLLMVVAIILWFSPGLMSMLVGVGTAIAGILATTVIVRHQDPFGAVLVHWASTALAAAGASALFESLGLKLLVTGVALMVVGGLGAITLRDARGSHQLGPVSGLIFAGIMTAWAGTSMEFLLQPLEFTVGTTATITALVLIMTPWLALAFTPIRSYIPRTEAERQRDRQVYEHSIVARYERFGRSFAISVKIGGTAVLGLTVPFIFQGGIAEIVLLAALGSSLLLNTRRVYARYEVMIGVAAGALVLFEAAVSVALRQPELLDAVLWLLIGVAAVVLVLGTLNRSYSASASRIADTISVIALLVIVPAAALTTGLV